MISFSDNRSKIRKQRQQLSLARRQQAAQAASRQCFSLARFQSAKHIALYLAVNGELDTLPLLERAHAMGKHCYLPVLHPVAHNRLWFARWQPGEKLRPNKFNIMEPVWTKESLIEAWALNMVIVPLVAFDCKGARLGMGGGYYDRSFSWRKYRQHWQGPLLVGYGYELQKLKHVSLQPWDVAMDIIVTENTLYMG
jgi:5-formyltetrahydrofolate cyclo-ligase